MGEIPNVGVESSNGDIIQEDDEGDFFGEEDDFDNNEAVDLENI